MNDTTTVRRFRSEASEWVIDQEKMRCSRRERDDSYFSGWVEMLTCELEPSKLRDGWTRIRVRTANHATAIVIHAQEVTQP